MSHDSQGQKNPKSCFINISSASGESPSKIEKIIARYLKDRGFEVKRGKIPSARGKTDKKLLEVIKSCGFGIVVYNEPGDNTDHGWEIMNSLDLHVVPFKEINTHINFDKDFLDKNEADFVIYSKDSGEEEIIRELKNSESLKSEIANIEKLIAENISPEESADAKEASKLIIESNIPLGEFGFEIKEDIEDINEIIDALNKVKDLTAQGRFYKAAAYYYARMYEDAEKELRALLNRYPNDAKSHNDLGNLFYNLKRYEDAEKEYRKAIRIDLNFAAAHNNRGRLLRNLEKPDESEKEYRKAIKINPYYAEAHDNLGSFLKDMGQLEEAEKEHREAIRIDPFFSVAHYNLGNLLGELKRHDEAEEEYLETIWLNPDLSEAHANLAILFSMTERPEESKKELEIAKELFKKQEREEDVEMVELLLDVL